MNFSVSVFFIMMLITCQIKLYICPSTGIFYVLPDNLSSTSCPSQPCATLNQYLSSLSPEMSNIMFVFLSGEHNLISNITMQHVYNVTMVGYYHNLSPAIIFCHSDDAVMIFINCFNITISSLVFKNCGGYGPKIDAVEAKTLYADSLVIAAMFISICDNCNITDVVFIGYGLVVSNLLGKSYLHNVTVHLNTTEHSLPEWCGHGLEVANYGRSPYYISHTLIHMSKITINGSNSQHTCQYFHTYGIHIHMEATDYNTTLILSDSSFVNVSVKCILKVRLVHTMSSTIILWIKHCKFLYNKYKRKLQEPTVEITIPYTNVTLFFTNCFFYENANDESPLISIQVKRHVHDKRSYSDYDYSVDWCLFPSQVQIIRCSFLKNMGSLIKVQGNKRQNCIIHLSIIGPFKIMGNWARFRDNLIATHGVIVSIIGEATFIYNSYGINFIVFDSCTVIFCKNISFIKNMDWYGSAHIITLQSDSAYIKIMENANIKFINNSRNDQAVQVKVENYTPHPFCAFQYCTDTSKNASYALLKNYSIIIYYENYKHFTTDNVANGNDGPSLNLLISYYTFHCQWLPEAVFYDYHPADINKQIIHTDDKQMYQHTRVCYCFMNNTYDCSLDLLGPVFPGQVLQVDLCVPREADNDEIFTLYIDTHNKFLPNSACKVAHQNQLISTITGLSKTYNFTIVSESENECELFLTAQPDLYKRYDAFYVKLLPCPIGFTLQNGVCDCDPILSIITDECYIDYSTIRRPANYWIVANTQANNTKYLISVCPMDYCLPYSSSVNLLHPDLQCQFNRTGILCSQCPHPLSMVFASSRCMKCTNVHILITIIVIVAGVVLVVLLYVLNLTVTNGTINGIIFYANIVSINDSVFLANDNVFKPLRVFISFINLDLGIETCFYNGMDSYAKMWLQLFFPSYLIIIAMSIIIASRYSTRILRLTYRRSLPVLATLFLLSYTGVLRTVLTVLFSYSTITHLPSGHQQLVWSIDASIPLFGLKFTILFITCLVLFLILIPFNATLLFTRYFLRFKAINHFKPLLDAFQGSYKDKYYYWSAVHLTLRGLLFAFYAFPTKLKLIFSTMLLISLGFYIGYIQPNKNRVVNIQELLLLLNLTIMYAVSYQGGVFFIVTNVMISLAFVQFGTIVMYHLLTYTCHCDITCMLKIAKQKLITKLYSKKNLSSDLDDIALLNIPECTYNYTEYRDGLVSDDFK